MMGDKKLKKVSVQLNPVQMVWLHSQHLFQKIEEGSYFSENEIKFFKNNSGVEIKFQGGSEQGNIQQLLQAKEQLMKVIDSNEIRLINTSLHKDLYIRISKEARKEFPKSYIIFLHYETFENCARKLHEKFNISSITPELEKLRKNNPNFCFLIAEKHKMDDIQKFTTRILNSEVSCASTTFSQHNYRRQQLPNPNHKKTMSVSSLRGSFSDQNQDPCRLSIHPNPVEEQMFEMSESIIVKLQEQQLEKVVQKGLYEGCFVHIQKYEGSYLSMTKKLYYANRLQLTANPYMQPVYAYSMVEKSLYRWKLSFISDKRYLRLSQVWNTSWFWGWQTKAQVLLKIGRALLKLHRNNQTYSDLTFNNVLIDEGRSVYLSSIIEKDVPPHTSPFVYDVRKYLLLIYRTFTEVELTYQMLLRKQQNKEYFCTISHRCKNKLIKQILDIADRLFIEQINLQKFLEEVQNFLNSP